VVLGFPQLGGAVHLHARQHLIGGAASARALKLPVNAPGTCFGGAGVSSFQLDFRPNHEQRAAVVVTSRRGFAYLNYLQRLGGAAQMQAETAGALGRGSEQRRIASRDRQQSLGGFEAALTHTFSAQGVCDLGLFRSQSVGGGEAALRCRELAGAEMIEATTKWLLPEGCW